MPVMLESPEIVTLEDVCAALGGVAPARVRWRPHPGSATEADLLAAYAEPDQRLCELVDGTLVEKAMGYKESVIGSRFVRCIGNWVDERRLGLVSGEAGFLRLLGNVRAPDVAYVSRARLPGGRIPTRAIPNLVPDLVVEVLSDANTAEEMARKRREYFEAGVRLLWEVDPQLRIVDVYTSPEAMVRKTAAETLDGGEVLPGFAVRLADIFAALDDLGE